MSRLTLGKDTERRLPWILRRGRTELCAFPTGHEALTFLRELLTAARP